MKCSCGYVTHNPQAKACELCQKPFKAAGAATAVAPAPAAKAGAARPKAKGAPTDDAAKDELDALADEGANDPGSDVAAATGKKGGKPGAAAKPGALGLPPVAAAHSEHTGVDTALGVLALPVSLPLAIVPLLREGTVLSGAAWLVQGLVLFAIPVALLVHLGPAAPRWLPFVPVAMAVSSLFGAAWLSRRGQGTVAALITVTVLLGGCITGGALLLRGGSGALASGDSVLTVALTPDGRQVVAGGADGKVRVYDTAGQSLVRAFEAGPLAVNGVLAVADVLVTGGGDGKLCVWPAAGGAARQTINADAASVTAIAAQAGPGGVLRLATGGLEGQVAVWSAADGTNVANLGRHGAAVTCVAFIPGAEALLTGAADGAAILWELGGSGYRLRSARVTPVTAVAVASDKKRVAVGHDDGAIEVFTLGDGSAEVVSHATGPAAVRGLAFTPGGTRLVACHDDWTVRVWDAATGAEVGSRVIPGNASPTSLVLGKEGLVVIGAGRAVQLVQLGELAAR